MNEMPPLVPGPFDGPVADAEGVLRCLFQDTVGADGIKKIVNQNKIKLPSDKVFDRGELCRAEMKVMQSQAKFLINQRQQLGSGEEVEVSSQILERNQLHPKVGRQIVNKYHLIQAKDLYPPPHERFFLAGPDYSGFVGRQSTVCLTKSDPSLVKLISKKGLSRCPLIRPRAARYRITGSHKTGVFQVTPLEVEFRNYTPGIWYEKPLHIRNITLRSVHFTIQPLSPLCPFRVSVVGNDGIAAPGVNVNLAVHFRGVDLLGAQTTLSVNVKEGAGVKVILRAYRDPPILKGLVFNLDKRTCPATFCQSEKEKVLNRSIDCGSCLLGDIKEVMLVMKNTGGSGKFFVISEDDWFSSTLQNVTEDGYLLLPPFCVNPAYMEAPPGGIVALQTLFLPRNCGAHVERVLIICDNCTVRGADLLGDGICMCRTFLHVGLPLKEFDINIDSDFLATHFLNLHNLPIDGVAIYNFCINNVGPVNLSFYWRARNPNIKWTYLDHDVENLPLENISIRPSSGAIEVGQRIEFCVTSKVNKYGSFRTIVGLYAACIPVESLSPDFPPQYVICNCECEMNRVDVLMADVEVWLQCRPTNLVVEPCVIDMTCGNLRGNEIRHDLRLYNTAMFPFNYKMESYGTTSPPESSEDSCPLGVSQGGSSSGTTQMSTESDRDRQDEPCKICNEYDLVPVDPNAGPVTPLDCLCPPRLVKQPSEVEYFSAPFNRLHTLWRFSPLTNIVEPESSVKLTLHVDLRGSLISQHRFSVTLMEKSKTNPEILVLSRNVKRCLSVSTDILDFGNVKHGVKISQMFSVNSVYAEGAIYWQIKEYLYNMELCVLERCEYSNVSESKGVLCRERNSRDIKYSLYTGDAGPRLSILQITAVFRHPVPCENHYILVQANIRRPCMWIEAPSAGTAILVPGEMLYVKTPTICQVVLRNCGHVPVSFMWRKPVGPQALYMRIRFNPNAAVILPLQTMTISVEITPKKAGFYDRYYVPCFIGRLDDPLILCVLCLVQDIKVSFEVPDKLTDSGVHAKRCKRVYWSLSDKIKSFPTNYEINEEYESEINATPRQSTDLGSSESLSDETHTNTRSHSQASPLNQRAPDNAKLSLKYVVSSINRSSWKYIYVDGALTSGRRLSALEGNIDNISTSTSLDKNSISSRSETIPESFWIASGHESLEMVPSTLSSSDGVIQIASLHFIELQTRKATKKTIIIRNETPIETTFTISMKYYGRYRADDKFKKIDLIHAKVQGLDIDEWSGRVPPEQGLIIVPDIDGVAILDPNGCYPLDIWVYADTWGWYYDILTCKVHGLLPFQIPVFVAATGPPIAFPLCIEPLDGGPTLDFGSFSYNTEDAMRTLKIQNTTGIPINVSWHCFYDESFSMFEPPPFNFVVDLFNLPDGTVTDETDKCLTFDTADVDTDTILNESRLLDCMVTNYYGEETLKIFQVFPSSVDLKPGASTIMTVYFSPCRLPKEKYNLLDSSVIKCTLVGFVRIADKHRLVVERVYRKDGQYIAPVEMNLRGNVLTPIIMIDLTQSDVTYEVNALDVMSAASKSVSFQRTYFLKNPCNATIQAMLSAEDPFKISVIKTRSNKASKNGIVLINGNDVVQVTVVCKVLVRHILTAWDLFNSVSDDVNNKVITVDKENQHVTIEQDVTITRGDHVMQAFELNLIIKFPIIELSDDSINFGPVLIGYKITKTVFIKSKCDSPISFKVRVNVKSSAIYPITKEGIIPAARGVSTYSTPVHIEFNPKEPKLYNSSIQIKTKLHFYNLQVLLIGSGTLDSKFKYVQTIVSKPLV